MADTLDPKHLDKRTAERYLRSGQLEEKAYERYIQGLPDVADKAASIETAMEADEFEDEDDFEDEEESSEEESASDEEDEDEDEEPESEESPEAEAAAEEPGPQGGENP